MDVYTKGQLQALIAAGNKREKLARIALAADNASKAAAIKAADAAAKAAQAHAVLAAHKDALPVPEVLHIAEWLPNGAVRAVCGGAAGACIRPATAATCPVCIARFFKGGKHG
jgi:hypothetical protein